MERIRNRATKVASWYLDLLLIEQYWLENDRKYHYTTPLLLIYALREALRFLYEEGLNERWRRHRRISVALGKGVEALGLSMFGNQEYRWPSLNAICVPTEVNDERVRRTLRNDFQITVSWGLGELKGKLWRVGLMGVNASDSTVILFLETLERILKKEKR